MGRAFGDCDNIFIILDEKGSPVDENGKAYGIRKVRYDDPSWTPEKEEEKRRREEEKRMAAESAQMVVCVEPIEVPQQRSMTPREYYNKFVDYYAKQSLYENALFVYETKHTWKYGRDGVFFKGCFPSLSTAKKEFEECDSIPEVPDNAYDLGKIEAEVSKKVSEYVKAYYKGNKSYDICEEKEFYNRISGYIASELTGDVYIKLMQAIDVAEKINDYYRRVDEENSSQR